jgi:pro-sigmaK processing inhibitor BofA
MKLNQAAILMIGMCVLVLVIVLAKNKVEFMMNVFLRMIFGTVGIHLLNSLFIAREIDLIVGINPGTVGTVGVLGIPGFLLVYAIALFEFL